MSSSTTTTFHDVILATAAGLSASLGKGILAADEGPVYMQNRFDKIGVENTHANRLLWHQALFSSISEWEQYICGVILQEENFEDNWVGFGGEKITKMLIDRGIFVGITVDQGLVDLAGGNDELVTQGLTDLAKRCQKYYNLGARFGKWRAVFRIGKDAPSQVALDENCRNLARYARTCQLNGLVPIVEPEVLMTGDYDIETCYKVTRKVLGTTFKYLHDFGVELEAIALKPSMVVSGDKAVPQASSNEIAKYTARVLLNTVPASVPCIMFLSGGQTEEEATINLNEINKHLIATKKPWKVSCSYGRALQDSARKAWAGKSENASLTTKEFIKRAKANFEASQGNFQV